MTDLVTQAAEVLGPYLATGAGTAASGLAESAGKKLSASVVAKISGLRLRPKDGALSLGEIEDALRGALAEGSIGMDDLQSIVLGLRVDRHDGNRGTIIHDSTVHIGTINNG